MSDTTVALTTTEELRGWLTERVGYYLERPAEELDTRVALTEYGLDSVYAFALCGDIEDTLRISVDPTLVWDVNTIDALTDHLSPSLARG
jgi:acyl carrier protein